MIKNDILIQRRGALSERINTSSRAIYFYCASVVRLEVERVSTSGPCLSRGACWSDTFSLDVSLWKRNVLRWDPHRWERLAWVLNDSRAATLLITVTPLWNSENCQKKWKWQRLICSLNFHQVCSYTNRPPIRLIWAIFLFLFQTIMLQDFSNSTKIWTNY